MRLVLEILIVVFAMVLFGEEVPRAKINLCLQPEKPKFQAFLIDLLEMRLLTFEAIETGSCDHLWPHDKPYMFRQEITEVVRKSPEDKNFQIISVLYDPHGVPILSQIEFTKRLSRSSMNERADMLAAAIKKAIVSPNPTVDPFSLDWSAYDDHQNNKVKACPDDSHHDHDRDKFSPSSSGNMDYGKSKPWQVELFFGGQRSVIAACTGLCFGLRRAITTKPYAIVGVDVRRKFVSFVLSSILRGTIMPLELESPLVAFSPPRKNVLKMVDFIIDASVPVMNSSRYELDIGIAGAFRFFHSHIDEIVKDAKLSRYWYLKQGFVLKGHVFFDWSDTTLFVNCSLFPLLQNFALPSQAPLINFSWSLAAGAQSTIYEAFDIRLSFMHQSDSFSLNPPFYSPRVVASTSLAYFGLVMNM